jgi:hypothetical protein
MRLPAPGSDPDKIVQFVDFLVKDSANDPRRVKWMAQAERATQLYEGDHYLSSKPSNSGRIRVKLNRIRSAIISLMAVQASDPPQATYRLRETGKPTHYYLNPLALQTLPPEIAQLAQPDVPLEPADAERVKALIAEGKQAAMLAKAMGQPPPVGILSDDVLIEVNDHLAIDARQKVFDEMWEECGAQFVFNENVLYKSIYGCASQLYEFNDDLKRHELKNTEPTQVFYQPTCADMSRNAYAVYDQFIAAEEGMARYPQFAKDIDARAREGAIQVPGNTGYMPTYMFQQPFSRDMVVVRTCWIRHQPYPLSPDDALKKEKVSIAQIPTGAFDSAPDPATGLVESRPVTRQAFVLGGTQQEVDLTHQDWPKKFGIRQLTIIVFGGQGKLVEDKQSEFGDIPLPNNVNMPIPFSPLGAGEPTDLEDVQLALNRVLSDLVTHQAYNAVPAELIDSRVADEMGPEGRKLRSKWDQRIVIPATVSKELGDLKKALVTLDVPAISPDFWKLLDFLVSMIDKQGNMVQVAQGDASATWSGEAIQSLQRAHNALVMAKSQRTEIYLQHLARLMDHSQMTRMTWQDWAKYLNYPPAVVKAIFARNQDLECQIAVEIASGSAASRQAESQADIQAYKLGIPISIPTILKGMGKDPDLEVQQQAQFEKDKAETQAELNPQMPVLPGQPSASNNPAEQQEQPAQMMPAPVA